MNYYCNTCQQVSEDHELGMNRDESTGWIGGICPRCGDKDCMETMGPEFIESYFEHEKSRAHPDEKKQNYLDAVQQAITDQQDQLEKAA